MTGVVTLSNGAAPSAPSAGITAIFTNASGIVCFMGSDGIVRPLWPENAPPSNITASSYAQGVDDTSLVFQTTATHTLTLLSASTYPGRILRVMNTAAFAVNSASANVYPSGSNTPSTGILAATAGKWALLQSDGTNWRIMANN